MAEAKPAGLAGIVAGRTAISRVDPEGTGLFYRGYAVEDLAEQASFEEVAWLLLYGELPTQSELACYGQTLQGFYVLPDELKQLLAILGAGRLRDEVVAVDGKPAVHRIIPLSLTFDHRAVTGGEATRFLVTVMDDLNKPS